MFVGSPGPRHTVQVAAPRTARSSHKVPRILMPIIYIQLRPGQDLCMLSRTAYKFVVVIEAPVSNEWRNIVSDWMVDCGCLYMMAWGQDCTLWDDAVDWANLAKFDFKDIPEEKSVMTTWHENVTLDEVFRFSKACAEHPVTRLDQTVLLHIATTSQQKDMVRMYEAA